MRKLINNLIDDRILLKSYLDSNLSDGYYISNMH